MASGPRKMERFPSRWAMTKRMRMMPVMATIHFLPIGEEKSGRQQEEVFLEEADPLMRISYRSHLLEKQAGW
jgi:hypothetical protein